MGNCICFATPESTWFRYGSAVEPGSQMEWNPDCPVHSHVMRCSPQQRIADTIRREVRLSAGIPEGQDFRCDWLTVAAAVICAVNAQ